MEYTIGELAERVGMTVEGLRFYERKGLLLPARRTAAGYRVYEQPQIETLEFVKAAQHMGFSLAEIQQLLELRAATGPCVDVRERLSEKLTEVRKRRRLLSEFERQLEVAIRRCDEKLASGDADGCPVLDELGHGIGSVDDA